MCCSYVHGHTNWSASAIVTFTVLLVTAPHRDPVHFNWLGSNSKVQGDGGQYQSALAAPRGCRPSEQIEYSVQNNSKTVI